MTTNESKNMTWVERVDLDDDQYYVMGGLLIQYYSELGVWKLSDCRVYPTRVISHHSSLEFAKVAGNEAINMKGAKLTTIKWAK